MTSTGHFLEFSIPADDVRTSLEFYLQLGFTEVPVNDIRPHNYAVVSDGRLAIGLHAAGFEEPTLSFVWPDVARHVRDLEDVGREPTFVELGAEIFNEAGLISPDGHSLRIMEAQTFSKHRFGEFPVPVIGQTSEISLRCDDYQTSLIFWQLADFITDDDPIAAPDYIDVMTLWAPGIVLGLRQDLRWAEPAVRFGQVDMDATLAELERLNIDRRRSDDGWLVTAPEGTKVMLFPEEDRTGTLQIPQ